MTSPANTDMFLEQSRKFFQEGPKLTVYVNRRSYIWSMPTSRNISSLLA